MYSNPYLFFIPGYEFNERIRIKKPLGELEEGHDEVYRYIHSEFFVTRGLNFRPQDNELVITVSVPRLTLLNIMAFLANTL